MKEIFLLPLTLVLLLGCTNTKKEVAATKDSKVILRSDTVNIVKLTDTLVIYESTCRGCAYESSTHFEISDSLAIVKLLNVITTDNNPPDMAGGSVSKELVLLPLKSGATTFKMYKFWSSNTRAEDSTRFAKYTIEVRN